MSSHRIFEISASEDIETRLPRSAPRIPAYLFMPPKAGKADPRSLPLIVSIAGWGQTINHPYLLDKLNPWLAKNYDAAVLCVQYHNIARSPAKINVNQQGLFASFNAQYEGAAVNSFETLAVECRKRGLRYLDKSCFIAESRDSYMNFGLLPALDCLQAVHHVLGAVPALDPRRVILFGSSYGGYLANLMSKFAPHSFAGVIDNAGFAQVNLRDVFSRELSSSLGWKTTVNGNLNVHYAYSTPWQLEDGSVSSYFSDAHRLIRSLIPEAHWIASETRHVIYHSANDALAPLGEKRLAVEAMKKAREVHFHEVGAADIDGQVFKNLEHGMNASLRNLFARVVDSVWGGTLPQRAEMENDFAAARRYRFDCGLVDYVFSFDPEKGVRVEREEKALQAAAAV
ncbi:MAG: DUF2920 family protein [Betaproteobacteria bacterium]|nr:DUF2920 family protein [Betaproteobacteria bacterium]